MADRGASELSLPENWPAATPDPFLLLNRMGCFVWDLDTGLMHMDAAAYEIFDVLPEEYDNHPETLTGRIPRAESLHLDGVISQAMKKGRSHYGTYFRVRLRNGSLRWTHSTGFIKRDAAGRPRSIHGIVRDATEELSDSTALEERERQHASRRWQTGIVQSTTAALSHARTVQDILDVLKQKHGLGHLGAAHLVMGLVENGRIRVISEGPVDPFERHTLILRFDEPYPMPEVIRTLSPRFVETPQEYADSYPQLWPDVRRVGVTSGAYLPLIAQGRPIGALGLLYCGRTGFDEADRSLLVALGSSIAQNLQRAMFYEQEKDLAEGLQHAMLPRSIPGVPGADIAVRYRSAAVGRDVGGDWYDVVALPGGRVGVVIGDVQGHDTHAAAVMGQLRIVLRAYAAEGHNPAAVMARASVFLHELDTDRFATCLYAEVDLMTGVVQVVRAGHLDPLIRLVDGSCHRVPVDGGLPIGLSAEFGALEYPVRTLSLEQGQMLVLCTDGLVEHPGSDFDDGMHALAEAVAKGPRDVEALADLLCGSADERGGEDDVALLLLNRRGLGAAQSGGRFRQHVAPGDPESLAEARRMIRTAVRAWGAGADAGEIELVTDELITNALIHTDGSAVVTLRVLTGAQRRLRVEVEDTSSALPRRRDATRSEQSGRGLLLVDVLCDVWGVEARGTGKCVWCEFVVRG
ncbi:SpoIIE family protein phosphatase [Streptomyces physcomitrii]|uniref:SpoIIE family protein phosphatase n=1 Tax=Streptomyces physcomitrii TaxID=2724184 RepID=A0ABX1H4E3_9ACTN|nr:SpoIIE family protein phosphatase [Streptomyces physcomitrii]NKI42124.1 SpoIIE family protein phosphatase [Streptomyces physcomitrii]